MTTVREYYSALPEFLRQKLQPAYSPPFERRLGVLNAVVADEFDADLIEVDTALREMEHIEPRVAHVVEYRFFGGLSVEETAETLGISVRTVKRDWILAKAWLYRKLRGEEQ